MYDDAVQQLLTLALTDPTAAPLARLQAEGLRAAADPAWEEALPALDPARLTDGLPLLHGQTVRLDPARIRDLLLRLIDRLAAGEGSGAPLRAWTERQTINLLTLVAASIGQDEEQLLALAEESRADPGVLAALAGVATLPVLLVAGRRATDLLETAGWDAGYCPVCAGWPALAELRGLERKRWLRCGRCGSGWPFQDHICAFCGNAEFNTLGYLAAEADRESRRALTCERCQSYLKTFTTLGPTPPAELSVQDLATLELDAAALDRDYARPEHPGFPLRVVVEPVQRRAGWWGRRG